ncbi:MAG: DNA repair protein RecO [Coriobacteriia bacterium]
MPAYRAKGMVLRKTKLGEADLILTILDESGGQVRAVAKGARKPQSKTGARTEPFTVIEALLHEGRSLDILREVETVATFDVLRGDLLRTAAASVVAEVLDKATRDAPAEPVVFELALATLEALTRAEVRALPAVVSGFMLKCMAFIGFRPVLSGCISCSSKTVSRFALAEGGVVCADCAAGSERALKVSRVVLAELRRLMSSTMEELAASDVPAPVASDTLGICGAFASEHLGARLRSLEFFTEDVLGAG